MTSPPSDEKPPNSVERDPRPIVRLPHPGLSGGVIALGAAILALLLFVLLDGRRHSVEPVARQASAANANAFTAPPPLTLPPEPAPPPEATRVIPMMEPFSHRASAADFPRMSIIQAVPPQAVMPGTRFTEPPAPRFGEPALVLDYGTGDTGGGNASIVSAMQSGTTGAAPPPTGDDAPVRATVIRNRTSIMPAGTVIPAVLETPIDSARPGLVRAIVSEDTRGFDGKRILVSRGSRLIGEYQSDVRSGQDRVLVTWTRLIRSDGVAIRIGSPAADALGSAGIPGRVNTFFFERFSSAVLQSALTIGVNLASRTGNGSVIVGLPANSVGTIGQGLLPANDLRPKIKVKQGAVLNVFVARDLDFSGAPFQLEDQGH